MKRKPRLLYPAILLMILGWSGNYIAGKVAMHTFPPVLFFGLRTTLAALLMLPVYAWDRRRRGRTWTRADVPILIVLGVLGIALNQFLFLLGLSRTSVAHSAILANVSPILVLLMATAIGQERISARKLVGVLVALTGVVLLCWLDRQPHRTGAPTLLGDFLTFCGAFAFAAFTVIGKPATKAQGTITVNTFGYVGGALLVAPVTLWWSRSFPYSQVPFGAWASLCYMAGLSSVICYLIFFYALAHLEASRLSVFSYIQPPVAAVLGVILLGEPVTLSLVLSAAVIFAGVMLTERAR